MQDATLILPAPAKLNLMLHILGRRPDGYHELQTLFQFIDHADQIGLSPRSDGRIVLQTAVAGVPHDDNLIVKAALALQAATRTAQGADIWLDKLLPMGGGLGGGSSDAATTLLGLNFLWKTQVSIDELAALGLKLGADVPMFVRGFAAFAEGVGERLEPVQPDEPWYLVVAPQVSVSTAEIFSAPELTRNTPAIKVRTVLERGGHNDCQPVVAQRYEAVRNALNWLDNYTDAKLTGTGGCVFGAFPSKVEADKVSALLPATLPGFVAKGCNVSPLHRELRALTREAQ